MLTKTKNFDWSMLFFLFNKLISSEINFIYCFQESLKCIQKAEEEAGSSKYMFKSSIINWNWSEIWSFFFLNCMYSFKANIVNIVKHQIFSILSLKKRGEIVKHYIMCIHVMRTFWVYSYLSTRRERKKAKFEEVNDEAFVINKMCY